MKNFILLCLLLCCTACVQEQTGNIEQVALIFDTDMGPDYDDVGALAVLHALADSGEVRILAVVSSNKLEYSVPCIDAINTYFCRPDIPLGAVKGNGVSLDSWHTGPRWTRELPARFPHRVKSTSEAEDAVKIYRRILNEQPDTSVVIVTAGFLTNLKNLLESGPDEISPLTGRALAAAKVKRLVSMAGHFPEGKEFNVITDITASRFVFEQWPTPIVFCGFEIGEQIITGQRTAEMNAPYNPVKEVYALCLPQDNPAGRYSWDQTTVLVAIRGTSPWFELEHGTLTVNLTDSINHWTPTSRGKHARLIRNAITAQIADIIENLMMHQPPK